jgi:DNA-binding transcriptional LysR family regulator
VAKRLNFTKAAEELYITQPAVSKHIHELEVFYETKLFERNGTRIKLTQAGSILLKYAEQIFDIHGKIEFELAALTKNIKGTLKVGASTTVAHYFLPKYLASFKKKFPDVKISFTSHNTEIIENLLSEGKIDIGIVEGQSKRNYLKYTCLVEDEIVFCTGSGNNAIKKKAITLADLQNLSMVVREPGSGSRAVVSAALKKAGVNFSRLKTDMEFENAESIKSYLQNSNSFAFLSMHCIFDELKAGKLKVIDIKGFEIRRCFYFTTQQGEARHLPEIFFRHLSANNYKL